MKLNTVIFDMDGLLIDSEPLWNEAATEVFKRYDITVTDEQYAITTGLRTKEFVQWWFAAHNISMQYADEARIGIIQKVSEKIITKGKPMPGLAHILNFFISRKFKIGLATSSPQTVIDVVMNHLKIGEYFNAIYSAEDLAYGKPHPQVYLNCAEALGSQPEECICFEDSFNGMIAVKAARMKCVVIPAHAQLTDAKWSAADLKISSLQNFNDLLLQTV
ncbi:hexitol phosphatase HxpB [Ferruginibacter albus]|uniref:hexitol phosphatase HxpB n=1 Tax=Ferruginibacter albus TaxID=2875540 RepID=UPI001CC3B472|nr:hexitol phosphatase HxpB [Ferruginibacter albus]UAY52650.1 hexitol phosphatase HxpB [Ferruginibacter albus]